MKKSYALFLAMLLFACGCSKDLHPEKTDTSTVSAENLAASIALTYHTAAWSDPIDTSDPLFVWQTIGWYTVYDGRLSGTDSIQITESEADEICHILAPDKPGIAMPEDFLNESVSQDGYIFEGTKAYFDSSGLMLWYDDGAGGYYNNFYFFTDAGRVHAIPLHDNGAWLSSYVSDANFDALAKMEYVSADGDTITFQYKYDSYANLITVDRGSLVIRSNQMRDTNGMDMGTTRYAYGDFAATAPITEDWNGEMRTVTLKMHEAAADAWTTEVYTLPVGWELDPSGYCPWGEAYLDADFNEKYAFPAGNNDYTIYITDAKG